MNYMHYGSGFGQGFGMMGDYGFGVGFPLVMSFVLVAVLWSILWKGLALWRAAKRGDMWWFIAFLFLNTLGVLEIIYLFVVTGAKLSDFTKATTHEN
jgi:hypothetical protein